MLAWCMCKPRRRRVRHLSVVRASDSMSSSVGALGQEMICHPSFFVFFFLVLFFEKIITCHLFFLFKKKNSLRSKVCVFFLKKSNNFSIFE